MMKLVYISPLRYPSHRGGPLFSMKSCETFASEKVNVELWIPRRRADVHDVDVFAYFGVKKNFKVRRFLAIDLTAFSDSAYYLLYASFAVSVFIYALRLQISGKIKKYVFYSHEQFALFLLTFISKKTFYEMHDFPGQQKIYRRFFTRIAGVIATNTWKAEELSKRFYLSKQKILVVPNAVDIESFSTSNSKKEARKKLGLAQEEYIFGYVGGLKTMGMEKGVATAILALQFLPQNFKFYVIGVDSFGDVERYKTHVLKEYSVTQNLLDRVIFAGQIPHTDVPLHISACDLVIAPFPKNDHYSYYMSPMKIFEYMASKRP